MSSKSRTTHVPISPALFLFFTELLHRIYQVKKGCSHQQIWACHFTNDKNILDWIKLLELMSSSSASSFVEIGMHLIVWLSGLILRISPLRGSKFPYRSTTAFKIKIDCELHSQVKEFSWFSSSVLWWSSINLVKNFVCCVALGTTIRNKSWEWCRKCQNNNKCPDVSGLRPSSVECLLMF